MRKAKDVTLADLFAMCGGEHETEVIISAAAFEIVRRDGTKSKSIIAPAFAIEVDGFDETVRRMVEKMEE